jgi:3,4-dihydroxy 2-butanone 4-phosphate synthase
MFSGHIRELGLVDSFDGERIQVRVPGSALAISTGGSVCVSGVRLTVQDLGDEVFGATVAAETRRRSTFDSLGAGDRVNVELPLTAGAALDGHLVQGYADAVGKVARVEDEGECLRAWIRSPDRLISQLVAKAPVAVDGVSVTIADRFRDRSRSSSCPSPARPPRWVGCGQACG